jgi:hypothetical protein
VEVPVLDALPAYFSVPTALVWIATRNVKACQEMVANEKFGLGAVSPIVSKYLQPCSVTIRDKSARFEKKSHSDVANFPSSQSHDNWDIKDFLREKGKIADIPSLESSSIVGPACTCVLRTPDNPPVNYEYIQAERELSAAVRAGDIVARTTDRAFRDTQRRRRGNGVYNIDPAHWLGREFKDEEGADGHYHVVAVAGGHAHLRSIRFKKEDIFQKWPPEGDQELSSKVPKSERHGAAEASFSARAVQSKPVAGANQRNRGRRPHKREAVEESMRKDIREGCLTPDSLRNMMEKQLTGRYGVSRDTARKARNNVLGQPGL